LFFTAHIKPITFVRVSLFDQFRWFFVGVVCCFANVCMSAAVFGFAYFLRRLMRPLECVDFFPRCWVQACLHFQVFSTGFRFVENAL